MTFELTVLGSSSALPTSTKFPSAQVLNVHERFFLIDCGEGTQMQLRKAKIKFGRIDHIFISHLHGDHVFGLFGLLSTYNLLGRKKKLHLYGHSQLNIIIDFYITHFAQDNAFSIEVHPLLERKYQKVYEDKVVEIFAFPLKHRVPTFGFLFMEKPRKLNLKKENIEKYGLNLNQILEIINGKDLVASSGEIIPFSELTIAPYKRRSFAYCSDTAVYNKITVYIEKVDLLYHEATFLEADKNLAKITGHSTALQAAKIALKANAGKLLIGHFSSRYKLKEDMLDEARQVFPETYEAEELKVFKVPLVRK
jgi:ribonuclease Z